MTAILEKQKKENKQANLVGEAWSWSVVALENRVDGHLEEIEGGRQRDRCRSWKGMWLQLLLRLLLLRSTEIHASKLLLHLLHLRLLLELLLLRLKLGLLLLLLRETLGRLRGIGLRRKRLHIVQLRCLKKEKKNTYEDKKKKEKTHLSRCCDRLRVLLLVLRSERLLLLLLLLLGLLGLERSIHIGVLSALGSGRGCRGRR